MSTASRSLHSLNLFVALAALAIACSNESSNNTGQGGSANGGSANGGSANGGSANGGSANGGSANGGSANGGSANGGSANGGSANGGAANGGSANGGSANGGSANGGSANGGSANGGSANGGSANGGSANGGSANGGSANGGSANGGPGGKGFGVLKIMAVGDSVTASTCWRAKLWSSLGQSHPGRFDLVGTLQSDSGCTPSNYDKDNQGYGSSLITEAVANDTDNRTCQPKCPALDNDFAPAFMSQKPDVVLLHYGTNDVWNGKSGADITSAYGKLIDAMRAANPSVKIFLAKIIPMHVTNTTCSGCTCASCGTGITALNAAIDAWAPTKSSSASPIVVVDQYTGFDADGDTRDGVHPNDSGSQKIADKWLTALDPLF